ncbi:MAG TPA: peptide-methionine (R)-S-oxide reductase, partial [Elusimicrobiales bacterium]|nr:peptide-methionine (R)-S-oxide reductase [Elusimicrobiales bacterium]
MMKLLSITLAAALIGCSGGAGRNDMPEDKTDGKAGKGLTPEQYRVMKQCGTETPFRNEYWDNKRPGLYVDPISGE